jgi:hypothetical protein
MDLLTTCIHDSAPANLYNSQITIAPAKPFFQPAVSSPAVPWQRLLMVKVLQLHALKSLHHGLPCRTDYQLKVQVTLRSTLSRPFCLGVKHPSGAYDQIFITVRQFPQPGGPGPCIYIPQEQGGPVIPSGVSSYNSQGYGGGIRTRLHAGRLSTDFVPNISSRTTKKTQLFHCCSKTVSLLRICFLATGTCLLSSCPEMVAV